MLAGVDLPNEEEEDAFEDFNFEEDHSKPSTDEIA